VIFALTLIAALGSGLVAGTFFAFSTFVMKSLAQLPARDGMTAMQSINLVILGSLFMPVFFGTAALSILALIVAFLRWNEPGAVYLFSGGLFYLVGSFMVTVVFNVPLNVALDSAKPADSASATLWAGYVRKWTRWNHVRTVASLAAAAAFALALG